MKLTQVNVIFFQEPKNCYQGIHVECQYNVDLNNVATDSEETELIYFSQHSALYKKMVE